MDLSGIRRIGRKKKKPKRLGRGSGSGSGQTSGRGDKGAGQRSGKTLPYAGFRGGNLPLVRTLPKRGFTPLKRVEYQIVNLRDIEKQAKGAEEVDPKLLKKLNLVKDEKKPIKILAAGDGDFSKKILFKADKFSAKAKELIEAAGGSVECLVR
jgi:large subunit ribosomal protein L15